MVAMQGLVPFLPKTECIHRQRLDSIQYTTRAIGDSISFYNNHRPHQALDMKAPPRNRFSGLTCADSAGSMHLQMRLRDLTYGPAAEKLVQICV